MFTKNLPDLHPIIADEDLIDENNNENNNAEESFPLSSVSLEQLEDLLYLRELLQIPFFNT